jgi:hypothetical protein
MAPAGEKTLKGYGGMETWFNGLASGDRIAVLNAVVAFLQFAALVCHFLGDAQIRPTAIEGIYLRAG